MGMTGAELDAMRALIRTRSGLPPPPPQLRPAPWTARAPEPDAPGVASDRFACVIVDEPPAAAPETADAGPCLAEAQAGWRPDASVHRLVEILMEMRALASTAAVPASPLQAVCLTAA